MTVARYSLLIVFFISLHLTLTAQDHSSKNDAIITGVILDDSTHLPIEDVNVFLSGTMVGSYTDKNGYYKITHVPYGNYELVASMVGYEVRIKSIYIKNRDNQYDFKLIPQPFTLKSIEVIGERPRQWLKDEKHFERLLFGLHDFSSDCKIENKEILEFDHPKRGLLVAKAANPLIITNNAMGYKLFFILKTFSYQTTGGHLTYTFKIRFEPLEAKNEKQKDIWAKNRMRAYLGSPRHFFKSLFRNKVHENGFRVFHVRSISYEDKKDNKFEVLNPYTYFMGSALLDAEKSVTFTDFMKIKYEPASTSISTFATRLEQSGRDQISWISLKYASITVDSTGLIQELLPYEVFGYWSRLGISTLLPTDYKPSK